MPSYYNEIDPYAAQWLRNLIKADLISPGDVDERSIEQVSASDLAGYHQCHFFAGIGVWSHALRQAGWSDRRQVWTGSCPCQPFSVAGRRGGATDARHLWPAWFKLIKQCNPSAIFGEQVASGDGLTWLDFVQADLEGEDYSVGAADLCASGVGAPHIRQRLYFVAESVGKRRDREHALLRQGNAREGATAVPEVAGSGSASVLGDAGRAGSQVGSEPDDGRRTLRIERPAAAQAGVVSGAWADADLIWCRDGKYRPVGSGSFPMVNGASSRVGRLRAYGNAIVAPVAVEMIRAYMSWAE